MSNQNTVWIIECRRETSDKWVPQDAASTRSEARLLAKEAPFSYTRVRKYIDSGDKT